jgi:hypothetical protein
MSIRRVGFFRELRHGDPEGPSLRDASMPTPAPNEDRVLAYLRSGEIIASTGVLVDDILDGSKKGIAVLEIATDGAWAWPTDLPHYLATYHVALPDDFIRQIERHGWVVPALSESDVNRASAELRKGAPRE